MAKKLQSKKVSRNREEAELIQKQLAKLEAARKSMIDRKHSRSGAVEYRCAMCNGAMKVNQSKSHPSFLAKRYRCVRCGRMTDTIIEYRETREI